MINYVCNNDIRHKLNEKLMSDFTKAGVLGFKLTDIQKEIFISFCNIPITHQNNLLKLAEFIKPFSYHDLGLNRSDVDFPVNNDPKFFLDYFYRIYRSDAEIVTALKLL